MHPEEESKLKSIQVRGLTAEMRTRLHGEVQYREASPLGGGSLEVRSIDDENRTATFSFAAGALVARWYGIEKLQMDERAIRMDRWKAEPPYLMDHFTWDQRGTILGGRLDADRVLRGDVKFSRTQPGEDLWNDTKDGIRKKTSLGYMVYADRELTPEEMTDEEKRMALEYQLPVVLVYDWEPIEGSSVWQNADMSAGLGRSVDDVINNRSKTAIERETDKRVEEAITKRLPPSGEQITNNNPQGGRTVEPITQEQLDAKLKAEREAAVAEVETRYAAAEEANKTRVADITAAAETFKDEVPDALLRAAKAAADKNVSVAQFYREINEARIAGRKPPGSATTPAVNMPGSEIRMDEFVRPWERRSVKYLNAKVLRFQGKHDKAERVETAYRGELQNMTQIQINAEAVECYRMVKESGLPIAQQRRVFDALNLVELTKRTAVTGTAADSGYLVAPAPLLTEIFLLVEKWGVARRYFRPMTIPSGTNALKIDNLATEAVASWTDEAANITATSLGLGQGEIGVKKLAGISAWSAEMDEDALIAWLPIFIASMARAIRKKEDLAGFLGDGTATYGSFTGMMIASTNIVTLAGGKTVPSMADADDYRTLRDAVNIDFREGGMYFLAPSEVSTLEGLRDLQGNYIYRAPAAGLPAQLWGYPIADSVGINALTQVAAAGLKFAAFGNPQHILMSMKRDVDILVSNEGVLQAGDGSISFNALQADGSIVRVTERVGFKQILTTPIAVLKTAAS
jgi:HK97 family phage major capsid protein